MKKFLAVAIALAMFAVVLPSAEAQKTQVTNYIAPQPVAILAVWCGAGGHNYAPIGDPDPEGSVLGWAFSGEPECAPTDVALGEEDDAGINGAAFAIEASELGSDLTVSLVDDNFDSTFVALRADRTTEDAESVRDEGCNSASITIPLDLAPHWQGEGNDETDTYHLVWAFIDGVYADQDTFDLCFGSSGTATAVYGF